MDPAYRFHDFRDTLVDIEHRRTRPYRPQTNDKVERFHRTLADEWAYARLYIGAAERCEEFPRWLPITTATTRTRWPISRHPRTYLSAQYNWRR